MPLQFINALSESGLSRVWQAAEKYDIAIITGWRHAMIDCVNEADCTGQVLTRGQKDERNKKLKAALLQKGYGVTSVNGNYIEEYGKSNAKEVSENALLTVNLPNDSAFSAVIQSLGKHFCQASVLIKPVGGPAALVGTNNESFPGLGQSMTLPRFKAGGTPGEFYSTVKGRPFAWLETKAGCQNNTKYIIGRVGTKVLVEAGIFRS